MADLPPGHPQASCPPVRQNQVSAKEAEAESEAEARAKVTAEAEAEAEADAAAEAQAEAEAQVFIKSILEFCPWFERKDVCVL